MSANGIPAGSGPLPTSADKILGFSVGTLFLPTWPPYGRDGAGEVSKYQKSQIKIPKVADNFFQNFPN